MSLKPLTKIKKQIYKCNKFFNVQKLTKYFSFQLQLGCLVSHLSFFTHSIFSQLSFLTQLLLFVTSLFLHFFSSLLLVTSLFCNLRSAPFPFSFSSQGSQTILSTACVVPGFSRNLGPGFSRNLGLHKRDLPGFCQTTTRFDPVFWSPARQLHCVFPVAPRGCCHHIIYDVQVTQVTVCV